MKSTEQEKSCYLIDSGAKWLHILVLIIFVLEAIQMRYSVRNVENEMFNEIKTLKIRQKKLETKVESLNFAEKTTKYGKMIFDEIRKNGRKRRHVANEQQIWQTISSVFKKLLLADLKCSTQINNTKIVCCLPGRKGDRGPRGKYGPRGYKGSKGDTGKSGVRGETGQQGPRGVKGVKGEKGDRGISGKSIEKPKIISNFENVIKVHESGNLTWYCEATGNPQPNIKWELPFKKANNKYIFHGKGGLEVTNIHRSDSGVIRCIAENILGKDIGETRLDVQFKPRVYLPMKVATTNVGLKFEVACNVSGNPRPDVTWRKALGVIRGRQIISRDGSSLKLQLPRPDIVDTGAYICSARNEIGSSTESILIQVMPQENCSKMKKTGSVKNGVYAVRPDNGQPFDVYCQLETDSHGWTVIQRRYDGSQDFYRTWNDYKHGFGDPSKEFWLGNDKIHRLTKKKNMMIRFDLEDTNGNKAYAEYDSFYIGDEKNKYLAHVGAYSGTAGNSFSVNGQRFSTKDRDNDISTSNCAVSYHGAWWYSKCHASNLNGRYLNGNHKSFANGVNWYAWKGHHYSLKKTEMKIREKA